MRLRYLLPIAGMLALGACHDEKKAENTPAPPTSTSAAPNPTPPLANADKPANH